MKKTILKLTSVALAFAVTAISLPMTVGASATKGANLIADNDPGFETRTVSDTKLNNAPFGSDDKDWISRGNAYVDDTHAHSGTNSIKISDKDSSGPRAVVTGLTPGASYWISAWVYTTQGGKTMKLGLQGANGTTTGYTASVPCTVNGWTQICGVVTAPAGGNAAVAGTHSDITNGWALSLTKEQSMGDHWIDDFEICEITSDPTTAVNATGNLMGENAGFELGSNTGWRTDSPKYTVIKSSADANSGNYAAHTTRRTANYNSPQMFIEDAALTDNTYYYASAMVRQGTESASTIKAKMVLEKTEGATSNSAPADSSATVINTDTYTKVASVIKNIDATRAKMYVLTNESSTTEGGLVNLWTDDYVLLPITSSVADGATDITPNTNITFSVPSDITVDATTLTINNGAEISNISVSGTDYTVSFAGMLYDTEYTVKLNTGLNISPTWTFKTESKNLLANYDAGFENGAIDTAKWNLSGGGTTRVDNRSNSGNYSAFVTNRTEGYHGPQAKDIPLIDGAKYYVSANVYTDATMTAQLTLQGSSSARTPSKSLTPGGWTKVEGMLTANGSSAKLYVATSATADIYVDDFELYKASDVTVSSTLDGASNAPVDSDLTLVFSDTVNLSAANLTINGAPVTGEIQTADNITYTIDLGTLEDFTDYTIKLKGVFDANYDRMEDSEISFTTASSTPGAVRNMLGSYDAGFENGPISTSKWNLSGTVERVSGGHDSSYAAKSSSPETYRGPQAKFTGLTEGEQYYVSAWVRTAQQDQTAQLCLQGASTVRTSNINLTANEWGQVKGIVTVPAPDTSTTNYDYRLYVNTGERTEDVYLDDFFMTPYAPTTLSSSTPADETTSVSLRETISLTFNNTLDEVQTLVDKFTVSGMTVTGAALQADKKTVVLTLNSIFDEYTTYTVTASGLVDQFGETAADSSITFTTGSSLSVTENAAFTRGGAPLAALTAGTVNIEATVANDGAIPVSKPVMIVTVYDAAGFLIDVVATEFGETLAGGTPATLSKTLTVSSEAKSVTVHIWKASNNISYMSTPATLTVAD